MWDTIPQSPQPTALAISCVEHKAAVAEHLHEEIHKMVIGNRVEKIEMSPLNLTVLYMAMRPSMTPASFLPEAHPRCLWW